jgi:hypothetical protein
MMFRTIGAWMLAASAACAAEAMDSPQSVRLVPDAVTLSGKGASQQFAVIGRYAGGRERDLTAQASISISDSRAGEIRGAGRFFAARDGAVTLEAKVLGFKAAAKVNIERSEQQRPFSFARDIVEIFTRRGCNSSGCHGGVKGQAGFKLSGDGIHPREDYRWIVEGGTFQVLAAESGGPKQPRIDKANPERSLLLEKAAMAVPHGGGARIPKDSDDYRAILDWVRNGASYGESSQSGAARIVGFEVFPREAILQPEEKRRILVTARYSDGRAEDFTHQVLYSTNDADIATVSPAGEIHSVRSGETAILIKAAGRTARLSVEVAGPVSANYPRLPTNNFIDEEVFAKLRRFSIVPSELSSDGEFLRRVCLDITGRLAPPARVREFLADKDPQKRRKLIDTLLESPEYVDYWTFRLADLFRVSIFPVGINPKWTQDYYEWIRDAVARDRPYDEVARERIAAQG